MAHRYKAPEHVTAVFTSTGEHRASKKGVIELHEDAPASDHEAMSRAGCVALPPEEAAEKAPAKSGK